MSMWCYARRYKFMWLLQLFILFPALILTRHKSWSGRKEEENIMYIRRRSRKKEEKRVRMWEGKGLWQLHYWVQTKHRAKMLSYYGQGAQCTESTLKNAANAAMPSPQIRMNSFQELEGCCLPSFSASASLAARSLNNMLYLPWSV